MNISKPFITKPVFTTLLMVVLVVFGIISYYILPVASIPQIEYPIIQVTTAYPGANADQMAKMVSSPLERQFMLMQGIKYVSSTNSYESSTIILEFHLDVDINIAAQETEEAIQTALAQLPPDLPQNPIYTKFNPSDTPIIYGIIYAPIIRSSDLYEYGYSFLGQQFSTVEGIANVGVYGFPYAVRIRFDPQALAAKGISLADIANAIKQENPQKPTGKFYNSTTTIPALVEGQLIKAALYDPIIIKYVNGEPVRIRDIAKAEDSVQNDKQHFKWMTKEAHRGMDACVLAVYRRLGYNTVTACEGIMELLNKLRTQIPEGIQVVVPFDLSIWIKEAVLDVEMTLILAFLLVVVVVYFYLGRWRNSVIPLITLPITVTGTFIFMKIFDYSLDIMSLSALTLSVGFLVDDAIIVLENIVRWAQEKKLLPYNAALEGSRQIILCVMAISLSLSAVFIPMLFLGGPLGQVFHEFAATIIIAVLVSGFISVSLTPMLSSRLLASHHETRQPRMEKFSLTFNKKLLAIYHPLLKQALKHRFIVILGALGSLILSLYLFYILPQEFLPENDIGAIQGFVQSSQGTSPELMEKYLDQISTLTFKNPAVNSMARLSATPTDNQSLLFYNLVPRKERGSIWKVIQELEEVYERDIVGAKVYLKAFPLINLQIGTSTSGKAQYQYILQSFNEDLLYKSVDKFIERLKTSNTVTHVSTDFLPNAPNALYKIFRDQAHSYGNINATTIENAFQYAYGESYISQINVPQDMYYVILQAGNSYITGPSKLGTLYVGNNNSDNQGFVNAPSLVEGKLVSRPETVNHINALPSVTVSFNTAPGVAISEAVATIEEIAKDVLPPNVLGSIAGNTAAFKETMKQLILLIILSIFVIYIILGILYENFLFPLTALSAIPVALLGGLLSLIIFGEVMSVYAMIGILMLLGIVMKNGILVIDFILEIMETEKLDVEESIIKACLLRFRPIIMTTIAAMMGAIPIATGIGGTVAEGRAPLGIVVIGGLLFSQLVTLFVTPVVFLYVHRLHTYFKKATLFKDYKES